MTVRQRIIKNDHNGNSKKAASQKKEDKSMLLRLISKLSNPRGGRHAIFAIASFIIVFYILYLYTPSAPRRWQIDHEEANEETAVDKETERKSQEIMKSLLQQKGVLLEHFCDSYGECFDVEQRYDQVGGKLVVHRMISIVAQSDLVLTLVRMITPKVLTSSHLDPLNWKVNKSFIVSTYNALQAAAGFMTGSLSLSDSSRPQRVLQIGMGGGATTNFLSLMPLNLLIDVVELEQFMYDVARKYFDLTKSEKIKVYIEDGVKFVGRAAERIRKYDSIMLDACTNDVRENTLCPAKPFLEQDFIENLSKILSPRGVVSLNMFATKDQLKAQMEVEKVYERFFINCFALRFTPQQKTLFCSNNPDFNWHINQPNYMENLEDFDYRMRTNLHRIIKAHNN